MEVDYSVSKKLSVSIAMRKHHDQKQLGKKRIYLTFPYHSSSLKEVRTGTQARQELKQDRNLEAGADAEAVERVYFLG
ncbi:hypothetical protein H671_4g12780 [Cricetulus griseus]|nr:hypothetical protein H671_4g12780 [Cricetulus griseus]